MLDTVHSSRGVAIRNDPTAQFWDIIETVRAGMLGIAGPSQCMEPITPLPDPADGRIWFHTDADSYLAKSARIGKRAVLCVVARNGRYHASVAGVLALRSPETLEVCGNPVLSAWLKGTNDPHLTTLEMELTDGTAWAADRQERSPEMRVTGGADQDFGQKMHLVFRKSARADRAHSEVVTGVPSIVPDRPGA